MGSRPFSNTQRRRVITEWMDEFQKPKPSGRLLRDQKGGRECAFREPIRGPLFGFANANNTKSTAQSRELQERALLERAHLAPQLNAAGTVGAFASFRDGPTNFLRHGAPPRCKARRQSR
jgi:hypothetical protein